MKKIKVVGVALGALLGAVALSTLIKKLSRPELDPNQALRLEYDLAEAVAAKSVEDRMNLVQLYVLFVGALIGLVSYKIYEVISEPAGSAGYLVVGVCSVLYMISWLFFLMNVRFRRSWLEAMNEINEVKSEYIKTYPELAGAIRWGKTTLQPADLPGTTSFYIATFIAVVQNTALVGGSLLVLRAYSMTPYFVMGGLILIWIQLQLYKRLLRK